MPAASYIYRNRLFKAKPDSVQSRINLPNFSDYTPANMLNMSIEGFAYYSFVTINNLIDPR